MSINQFSTDLQETPWWTQQQQQMETTTQNGSTSSQQQQHEFPATQQQFWPSHHHHNLYHQHQLWFTSYNSSHESPSIYAMQNHPTLSFNLNQHDNNDEQELDDQTVIADTSNREQESEVEKEPMFEKPLTPSDVGKLNRLVIPKQHAEKYFPLGGDSGDKCLLLSFEDESGKCWRFRYSYWNSSQSYVLTKGWSRYVKEKRLDAGDVILFERHRADSERLFIGWRRRGAAPAAQDAHNGGGVGGGGAGWSRGLYSGHPYPVDLVQSHGVTVPYQSVCLHADSAVQNQTTPVGNSKTLRLFGVNLECQLDESEPSTPDGSTMSSQVQAHHHHYQQQQFNYWQQSYNNSSNRYGQSHVQEQQDITFSEEDVKEMMRNRQG